MRYNSRNLDGAPNKSMDTNSRHNSPLAARRYSAASFRAQPFLSMAAAPVVVGLFVASWFVPGTQIARAIAAFIPVASLMLIIELTAEARQKLSSRECWRIRRAPISEVLSWRSVWLVLLNLFITLSAFLTLFQTRHPSSNAMSLLRLGAGVALLYAAAELVFEVCGLCFLASSPLYIDPGLRLFGL